MTVVISTPNGDVELSGADAEAFLASLPDAAAPTIDDYRREIQSCVDAKAQERGYDGGQTIATYVASTVPSWAAEAQAFVEWRDAVWVYAYTELAKVENGEREAPTPGEFCREMPALSWPE